MTVVVTSGSPSSSFLPVAEGGPTMERESFLARPSGACAAAAGKSIGSEAEARRDASCYRVWPILSKNDSRLTAVPK